MNTKYLVIRTFKAGGKLYEAGTIVDDLASIKLAKIRINEGKLILLPTEEADVARWQQYFRLRYNIDLEAAIASANQVKGSDIAEPVIPSPPVQAPTTPGTPGVTVAKPMEENPPVAPQTPGRKVIHTASSKALGK